MTKLIKALWVAFILAALYLIIALFIYSITAGVVVTFILTGIGLLVYYKVQYEKKADERRYGRNK